MVEVLRDSRSSLDLRVAVLIAERLRFFAKSQDNVTFAIPGGSSVSGIFAHLIDQQVPWDKVQVFMVDERLVDNDSPESNFAAAKSSFLDVLMAKCLIPEINIHPYRYQSFPAAKGAVSYKNEFREVAHKFDVVLLSAGEDGHVASLFPGHETIENNSEYFVTTDSAPKLPLVRISASRKLLEKSSFVVLLFFGDSKLPAWKNYNNSDMSVVDCPAKLVDSIENVVIATDLS